ncbi:MAG: alpha/beta hydrolase [Leptospiraceae bacterium]|nr:alpha/beta hydrolase [Leptospiraceae bacterium]
MKEVDVQGHKFTYEEMGEGKEDLVFIHGWSSSRFFWKPVLSEFMEFGKITNLDLVGHYPGSSPKSFRNFGADKVIEIQAEALRKIFPEKKLTLIGHSTGGYVVLGIAARYPELVNRVIVICPVVHGPVEGLLALMKLSYEWNLSPVVSFALQSFMMSPNSMEILMNGSV